MSLSTWLYAGWLSPVLSFLRSSPSENRCNVSRSPTIGPWRDPIARVSCHGCGMHFATVSVWWERLERVPPDEAIQPCGGHHAWLGLDIPCNRFDCSGARVYHNRRCIFRNRQVSCGRVPHLVPSVRNTWRHCCQENHQLRWQDVIAFALECPGDDSPCPRASSPWLPGRWHLAKACVRPIRTGRRQHSFQMPGYNGFDASESRHEERVSSTERGRPEGSYRPRCSGADRAMTVSRETEEGRGARRHPAPHLGRASAPTSRQCACQ